jgi:hypothetical protein
VNSFAPVPSELIDVVLDAPSGYSLQSERDDTTEAVRDACGSASRDFPESLWLEEKDWPEVARQNDLNGTWPIDFLDRFTNQGSGNGGYSTHECTAHSLRACMEAARNRQRAISIGPPQKGVRLPKSATSASVWLAPNSVYPEANPGQWGGANVRQVMEIACRRGMLPETIQPREYGFKHAIPGTCGAGGINQARGPWLPVSRFPEGWQETASHFKPLEVIFPENWRQAVCLVLHGYCVGVGRNGHAIPWCIWNPTQRVMGYTDSYDVVRYDSLSTVQRAWQGAFAIATTTIPDDWNRPAG